MYRFKDAQRLCEGVPRSAPQSPIQASGFLKTLLGNRTLVIAMAYVTFPGPQGQGKQDTRVLELTVCVCSKQVLPGPGQIASAHRVPTDPAAPGAARPSQDRTRETHAET